MSAGEVSARCPLPNKQIHTEKETNTDEKRSTKTEREVDIKKKDKKEKIK